MFSSLLSGPWLSSREGKEEKCCVTAVVKKVVGTHYFLAIFGPIGAHFSSQPLRQPHGTTASHIVKVNHTVVEKELGSG